MILLQLKEAAEVSGLLQPRTCSTCRRPAQRPGLWTSLPLTLKAGGSPNSTTRTRRVLQDQMTQDSPTTQQEGFKVI